MEPPAKRKAEHKHDGGKKQQPRQQFAEHAVASLQQQKATNPAAHARGYPSGSSFHPYSRNSLRKAMSEVNWPGHKGHSIGGLSGDGANAQRGWCWQRAAEATRTNRLRRWHSKSQQKKNRQEAREIGGYEAGTDTCIQCNDRRHKAPIRFEDSGQVEGKGRCIAMMCRLIHSPMRTNRELPYSQ